MAYIPPNSNGQATSANSAPVVVASDQSPLYTYLTSPTQVALGMVAKVTPGGALQVEGGLTTLLSDTFDTALDTTNKWTVSGTTLPATSSGAVLTSLGATNSVSSVLVSQPSFIPEGQSQLLAGQVKLGSQQTNPNAHTFFGTGVVTGYTAANPITNGFGFERDVTGALNCVVYINGTRYVANSTNPALITSAGSWAADMVLSNYGTNLTWPTSGTAIVLMRYFAGLVYFYMAGASNGLDVPVAIASYKPGVVNTPVRFASITTPAVSTVLATTSELSGFILGSVDGTDINIADPNYPWRQAAVSVTTPAATDGAMAVRQVPDDIFRVSFADAYTSAVAPEFTLLQTGTGMAVNQTGGNLVITTGTTANSETVIRSVRTFKGALLARYKTILSQRIVQNNFIVELADLVQDGATYVINSATSVTVTFTTNPFTSINVGQFCNLGVITGAAGLPGRYAIASVSGLTVTFTVASWPGSGSGTLCVYGYNYIRSNYNSTTATAVGFDTQRKGWNTGDTSVSINTTASPGHVGQFHTDNAFVDYADSLVASATAPNFASRGSRLENVPSDDTVLYLWIRTFNGTSNPATTTTWTVGMVHVEQLSNQKVMIAGVGNGSPNRSVPTTVTSGTVILGAGASSIGSITTVVPGTAATNLGKAEDAVAASGDTGVFALGVQRASPASNAANGDYVEFQMSPSSGLFVATIPISGLFTATPTISSGAIYAAGDLVGTVMTFNSVALATGRSGQIVGSTIIDKGKQNAALQLWLFAVSPTLVNTDNGVFDITDANLVTALPIGVIDFAATDYRSTASNSIVNGAVLLDRAPLPFTTSGGANIFGALVTTGTPTYTSTTDLVVYLNVQQF